MSDQWIQNKSGVKSTHKYELTVQIFTDFNNIYFRKFRLKSEISENIVKYLHTQEKPVEILTLFHRDLIVCCMTAPPPLLSPSNILPPSRLITFSFPQGETAVRASKMSFQNFTFLKLRNFKLHLSTEFLTLSVAEI
jgi:hypothetical protein